jgi:hypothetical protein
VVLWTDGEGLWSRAIPLLQDAMPELLVLAPEIADERTGPSTWLRYRLARGTWEHAPVVYLPGVARYAFRGAAGFPEAARHLFALQFQGQFWSQQNGKDWTPSAFLSSKEGGLGLDLARDRATLDAVGAQLTQVLRAPVSSLVGRRLEAADFHGLAAGDPVGLLLEWMATGDGSHGDWSTERWAGFKALCKPTFGLDPDKDGIITAVDRLVAGGGSGIRSGRATVRRTKPSPGYARRSIWRIRRTCSMVPTTGCRPPTVNRRTRCAPASWGFRIFRGRRR